MAVELVRRGAHGRVVVDEETVQPAAEYEDIVGFGYVQTPCRGLVGVERWVLPIWAVGEGAGRRWGWLEVGRFGLGKANVVVRGPSEVVVNNNVVLGPRPNEPDGTLGFGQQATPRVDGCLIAVHRLDVVIGEPDPRPFEVGGGMTGQVDGQECSEALRVSDVRSRTL